jgi:hypothetical protein
MPYKDRLESWAVIRLLPKMQRVTVARRCTASDAEGYCQILRRLEPDAKFIVVFDPVFDDRTTIMVNGDT